MTFTEIVQEVVARGYDYVAPDRIERWVQQHHQAIEGKYVWPWGEETKEGKAPLEIKDLRDILSVTDSTQERPLWGTQRQWLLENYPKLEEQGNPVWWFLDNITLRLFPLSSSDVKKPAELTAEAEPAMPAEWHGLIVDFAVVDCLKDNDEYQEARELKEAVRADLQEMVSAELQRDLQAPPLIVRTGYYGDYL